LKNSLSGIPHMRGTNINNVREGKKVFEQFLASLLEKRLNSFALVFYVVASFQAFGVSF